MSSIHIVTSQRADTITVVMYTDQQATEFSTARPGAFAKAISLGSRLNHFCLTKHNWFIWRL